MQVIFLEKQYISTYTNKAYPLFKNNKSPLIIAAKYHFIELYIKVNKNKKRLFTIRTNYLTYPATQQDVIQKSLDQFTPNILMEIEV